MRFKNWISTREPSLSARVVSRPEVIESRLVITFLEGELLTNPRGWSLHFYYSARQPSGAGRTVTVLELCFDIRLTYLETAS